MRFWEGIDLDERNEEATKNIFGAKPEKKTAGKRVMVFEAVEQVINRT